MTNRWLSPACNEEKIQIYHNGLPDLCHVSVPTPLNVVIFLIKFLTILLKLSLKLLAVLQRFQCLYSSVTQR